MRSSTYILVDPIERICMFYSFILVFVCDKIGIKLFSVPIFHELIKFVTFFATVTNKKATIQVPIIL